MKKNFLLTGIVMLVFLYSCQKDAINTNQPSNESLSRSKPDKMQMDDIIFYALGEGNKLDKFSTDKSGERINSVTIKGLQINETIMAIDFRPATGQLYGLGSTSRIYVINLQTGAARMIGAGAFSPALSGTIAGFDFNPTVDRIRIVTSTGQNLRANPETGTVAVVDGPINGVAGAMITSVAYTNSMAGAASTVLFDIDVATNKLYKQNPPNNGTLEEVGSLNIDVEGEGGFDIAVQNSNSYGNFSENSANFKNYTALAIYQVGKKSTLLSIDLETGKAKKIEKFKTDAKYYGIAIPTPPVAYAVNGSNLLIFNPANSSAIISKPITGLQAGEMLVGIDFRPLNGQIYGIGSNSRIYTLNASSGAAAFVATLSVPLMGTSFGVDFNPVVDRIRVVSNTGQNLRINPVDGVTISDGGLNPGMPAVTAAAYENNFAGTMATKLFVIDTGNDILYVQNPPNAGTLVPVGQLGMNVTAMNGFDIGGTSNMAYAVFTSGSNTNLYVLNKATGNAVMARSLSGSVMGFTIGLGF